MISLSVMPRSKRDAKQSSASQEDAIDRPLEYLFTSSYASIESFRLSRLNAVANLRKELHEIFEEWVEAEVQARLAQWLLARKNPERAAAAHPATIDSLDRSAARRTIRPAARLTAIRSITRATLDSAAQSALARPSAADSPLARVTTIEPSDFATIGSAAIECAITRSATRAADSRPMNRPAFTRSATACRTMQSLALVHPSAILKPRKLSKALLRASMNSSRTPPAVNKQSRHRLTLLPLSRCK
jgi:hypothetical protein